MPKHNRIIAFLCMCLFSTLLSMRKEDLENYLPPLPDLELLAHFEPEDSFIEHLISPVPIPHFPSPFDPRIFQNPDIIKFGNCKPSPGYPLHDAIEYDCPQVVDYLVKSMGINPNTADSNGDTPMHIAIRRRKMNAVRALLYYKVNLYIKNDAGKTPWDLIGRCKLLRKYFKKKDLQFKKELQKKERPCKIKKLESGD